MDENSKITALNSRFGVSGLAQIVAGNGGLPKIRIETSAATSEIYLHGAQITAWQPSGLGEVLFLSGKSHWQDGKAIRGGIPVCFPWFRAKADDPHAPSHGFVRTKTWTLDSISSAGPDAVCVRFSTGNDDNGRKWWPFEFRLEYAITVGKSLGLELTMKNTGEKELSFEEALHTYFRVGEVRQARVLGLDGADYLDNRDGNREKKQEGDLVLTKQTDNAFRDASGSVEIVDPLPGRRLVTRKRNSASTIVWNPWSDGAAGMSDFGGDEWQTMLCAEGGNILDAAVKLAPGQTHTLGILIEVFREVS